MNDRHYKMEAKRRRLQKLHQEMVNDPPVGFVHQKEEIEGMVRAGEFLVKIDQVTSQNLRKMRVLLPRADYAKIVNCRRHRVYRKLYKTEREDTQGRLAKIAEENEELRRKIAKAREQIDNLKKTN